MWSESHATDLGRFNSSLKSKRKLGSFAADFRDSEMLIGMVRQQRRYAARTPAMHALQYARVAPNHSAAPATGQSTRTLPPARASRQPASAYALQVHYVFPELQERLQATTAPSAHLPMVAAAWRMLGCCA